MTRELTVVLAAIGAVALIAAFVLSYYATSRYGAESAPRRMCWNPRDWWRGWNTRHYFTEARGYKLSLIGRTLFLVGALASFIALAFGHNPLGCL